MEHISQALQRAADTAGSASKVIGAPATGIARPQAGPVPLGGQVADAHVREVALRHKHLEAERIVAYDSSDQRTKSFDMLRTQILQSMDLKEWQVLAVTSPTPGCGKTLTAINLALSIARQPERSVLLVDLDLQRPQIATRLNLPDQDGVMGIIEGKSSLADAMTCVRVGQVRLPVLPCERPVVHSSEVMASSAMAALLRELRQGDRSPIVILDLPPILTGDDVLSILPQVDCVLFVAAVGISSISEIKDCNKHLQSTSVVRIVLNKSAELSPSYY